MQGPREQFTTKTYSETAYGYVKSQLLEYGIKFAMCPTPAFGQTGKLFLRTHPAFGDINVSNLFPKEKIFYVGFEKLLAKVRVDDYHRITIQPSVAAAEINNFYLECSKLEIKEIAPRSLPHNLEEAGFVIIRPKELLPEDNIDLTMEISNIPLRRAM